MATLPGSKACVSVGPPLFCKGPRLSCAGVTWVKPGQVPLVVKLTPVAFQAPKLEQSPPDVLLATIEFLMLSVELLRMPPPLPLAELPDSVVKLIFAVPLLAMPPPLRLDESPDSVLLVIVSALFVSLKMPPPLVVAVLPDSVVKLMLVVQVLLV